MTDLPDPRETRTPDLRPGVAPPPPPWALLLLERWRRARNPLSPAFEEALGETVVAVPRDDDGQVILRVRERGFGDPQRGQGYLADAVETYVGPGGSVTHAARVWVCLPGRVGTMGRLPGALRVRGVRIRPAALAADQLVSGSQLADAVHELAQYIGMAAGGLALTWVAEEALARAKSLASAVYRGPDPGLRGRTALALPGEHPDVLLAQFDLPGLVAHGRSPVALLLQDATSMVWDREDPALARLLENTDLGTRSSGSSEGIRADVSVGWHEFPAADLLLRDDRPGWPRAAQTTQEQARDLLRQAGDLTQQPDPSQVPPRLVEACLILQPGRRRAPPVGSPWTRRASRTCATTGRPRTRAASRSWASLAERSRRMRGSPVLEGDQP